VVATVLAKRAVNSWGRLKELDPKNGMAYRDKIRSRGIVFTLLFLATAAVVGGAIGKHGQEAAQMTADFREMAEVGKRISQARNSAARTVPAYVEMYTAIEGDVGELDSVLRRLRTELDVYDGEFPDQHEEATKSIHSIEVGLRRASLLRQQIAVAKDIDPLDPEAHMECLAGENEATPRRGRCARHG
jgi:hypothetical protein